MAAEQRPKEANMREVRNLSRGRRVPCHSTTHEAVVRFYAAAGPSARHAISPIRSISNVVRLPGKAETQRAVVSPRTSTNHTRVVTACRKACAAQVRHHAHGSNATTCLVTCTPAAHAADPALAMRRAHPRPSVTCGWMPCNDGDCDKYMPLQGASPVNYHTAKHPPPTCLLDAKQDVSSKQSRDQRRHHALCTRTRRRHSDGCREAIFLPTIR